MKIEDFTFTRFCPAHLDIDVESIEIGYNQKNILAFTKEEGRDEIIISFGLIDSDLEINSELFLQLLQKAKEMYEF